MSSYEAFVGEAAGIVPTLLRAAQQATIQVHALRRNVSVLEGAGANIAVLTGPDGKLLVDSGVTVSQEQIAAALNALATGAVPRLINTHWHFDHTGGNAWLHAAGASIIAHENTKRHMAVETRVEDWQWTFPAAPPEALPEEVFATDYRLDCNQTAIVLEHYSPCHTDGDLSVTFTEADILHVGDTWWNGVYPFIDYSTGGNIDGMIHATERNIEAVTPATMVIPGHGPVGRKSDLIEYRDMLMAVRYKVASMKRAGRSLEEIIAAKPTAKYDAKWAQGLITPALFTELVYKGV